MVGALSRFAALLLPFFVVLCAIAPAAAQIFVKADATGANDGSSWADAYADLQDALAVAVTNDAIWVAAGTYVPTTTGDMWAAFTLQDSVSLYGGFAGTESSVSQRDIAANPTILSGEIGAPGFADNSERVIFVPTGTSGLGYTVDGFTVTRSKGLSINAGILNNAGDFTYANLVITDNAGGGMYCTGQPILRNVVFSNNSDGALFNHLAGDPVLEDCRFIGNTTNGDGGAVRSFGSGITLTRCDFVGNTAASHGGAIYGQDFVATDCTFDDNHALSGNGGAVYSSSAGMLRSCVFTNNSASALGGAVHAGSVTIIDAVFESNQAGWGGGLSGGSVVVANTVFFGNAARTDGGAIQLSSGSSLTMTNVSCSNNSASRNGGAINTIASNPIVTNGVFWSNSAGAFGNEFYNLAGGSPLISYSIVQGSGGSGGGWDPSLGVDGGNNVDLDPLFADQAGGNLRLQPGSPAIDAGWNSAPNLQPLDLDGNARIVGSAVDMGAYEYDPATGVGDDPPELPFVLEQNRPNPFNPTTVIRFALPRAAKRVELAVYTVRGERVRLLISGPKGAGPHSVVWHGLDDRGELVSSGVFFYRLQTPWGSVTRRAVLIK
jgi:predicted outer membrane repeat protein